MRLVGSRLLLPILALVGCDNGNQGGPDASDVDGAPARSATVALVHASADAPDVDVYVRAGGAGQKALSGVKFGQLATATLGAGSYNIEVRAAGSAEGSTPILTKSLTLAADQRALLVALGPAASLDLAALDPGQVDDANAKLRVLHASVGAPALGVASGGQVIGNLARADFGKPTDYAQLSAAVAAGGKVSLRPAGNNLELATLTLPTLAKGSVTTAIALGDISPVAGARFLSFLLVNDLDFKATPAAIEIPAGTTGQILLVHAAPGVPAVSLGLKGAASALTGVAYKTASKLTSLPAGNGDVELRPAMGNPLLTVSARFLPALSWTLVAVGKSGGTGADAPQLRAFPRLSVPTDLGTGNLRFVHAALGVPSVDVLAGAMPLFSGVAFGQATAVKVQTLSDALKALLTGTGLVVNQAGTMTRLFGVKLSPGAYAALDGAGVSVVATGINKDANNPAAVLAVVETDATTMRAATTIELTVAP